MTHNKLWNTGVDDNGNRLPYKSIDPHWKLIRGPHVTSPQDVILLDDQQFGLYAQTTDSMWVWFNRSGWQGVFCNTPYVFQQKFFLEVDLSDHWIEISGQWCEDNFGQITLDDMPLPAGSGGGELALPESNGAANYTQTHAFSISTAHRASLSHLTLSPGWHSLEVTVINDDPAKAPQIVPATSANPAGFNVSALNLSIKTVFGVPIPIAGIRRIGP